MTFTFEHFVSRNNKQNYFLDFIISLCALYISFYFTNSISKKIKYLSDEIQKLNNKEQLNLSLFNSKIELLENSQSELQSELAGLKSSLADILFNSKIDRELLENGELQSELAGLKSSLADIQKDLYNVKGVFNELTQIELDLYKSSLKEVEVLFSKTIWAKDKNKLLERIKDLKKHEDVWINVNKLLHSYVDQSKV